MWVEELRGAVAILCRSSHGCALFEVVGTPYYVQLSLDDEPELGWVRRYLSVEARSNLYLYEDVDLLTPEQEERFGQLGWSAPGDPCDERCACGEEHGNWFRYATLDGVDESGADLVSVVLAALGVYGASEGAEVNVSYDCSEGRKGNPYCD